MLFLPRGVAITEIVDPEKLAMDFVAALGLAGATTQYQWKQDGFSQANIGLVSTENLLLLGPVSQIVHMQFQPSVVDGDPKFPDDAVADTNMWKIPYNRGYDVIGRGAGTEMLLRWDSTYPEMVFLVFCAQYCRRSVSAGAPGDPWYDYWAAVAGRSPRMQSRLRLDGALLAGTGPFASTQDGLYRGTGYGHRGMSLCAIAPMVVPPGSHILEAVAGQAPAEASSNSVPFDLTTVTQDATETENYGDAGPTDGICIGNRLLFGVRIARGGLVRGMQ
ncbi:MAG: hypothetical protein WC869_08120 [Phycisphaerae bacterium]|jgi:hypothetical protein